jgi:hypothetical protein
MERSIELLQRWQSIKLQVARLTVEHRGGQFATMWRRHAHEQIVVVIERHLRHSRMRSGERAMAVMGVRHAKAGGVGEW